MVKFSIKNIQSRAEEFSKSPTPTPRNPKAAPQTTGTQPDERKPDNAEETAIQQSQTPQKDDKKEEDQLSWIPQIPQEEVYPTYLGDHESQRRTHNIWSNNGGFDREYMLESNKIKTYGYGWAHWLNGVGYSNKNGRHKVIINQFTTEYTVINGKVNGLYKDYYNGRLQKEEHYVDNKLHGPYREYHENGAIKLEINYVNGIAQGPCRQYDSQGNIEKECFFKDGLLSGPYKVYSYNGLLVAECNFEKGLMHGTYKQYFLHKGFGLNNPPAEPGVLFKEVKYVNGQKEGVQRSYGYLEDGTHYLESEYTFKNGRLNGDMKTYRRDGSLRSEGKSVDGETEGLFKTYYPNGQIREIDECKNGKTISIKKYDKKGNLTEELECYTDADGKNCMRKKSKNSVERKENTGTVQSQSTTRKSNGATALNTLRINSQPFSTQEPTQISSQSTKTYG